MRQEKVDEEAGYDGAEEGNQQDEVGEKEDEDDNEVVDEAWPDVPRPPALENNPG